MAGKSTRIPPLIRKEWVVCTSLFSRDIAYFHLEVDIAMFLLVLAAKVFFVRGGYYLFLWMNPSLYSVTYFHTL